MFNRRQLAVVRFCANECVRQHTGPEAVPWMLAGYQYAAKVLRPILRRGEKITGDHILALVAKIEPKQNRNGFRRIPVRFADGTVLENQESIPNQIERLLSVQTDVTAAQFYQEYEEIHPNLDGNGRAGAILFNLFGGTLDKPVVPPRFKRGRKTYQSSFGEVEQ